MLIISIEGLSTNCSCTSAQRRKGARRRRPGDRDVTRAVGAAVSSRLSGAAQCCCMRRGADVTGGTNIICGPWTRLLPVDNVSAAHLKNNVCMYMYIYFIFIEMHARGHV